MLIIDPIKNPQDNIPQIVPSITTGRFFRCIANMPPKIANNDKIRGKMKHNEIQIGTVSSLSLKNGIDGKYKEKMISGVNNPRRPTIINIVPLITKIPLLTSFVLGLACSFGGCAGYG